MGDNYGLNWLIAAVVLWAFFSILEDSVDRIIEAIENIPVQQTEQVDEQ